MDLETEGLPDIPNLFTPVDGDNGQDKNPEGWEEEYLGAVEGNRNDSLTKLAGQMIAKGMSRPVVHEAMLGINQGFNPPLFGKEVETILNSVWKIHRQKHPDISNKSFPEDFKLPTFEEIGQLEDKTEWIIQKVLPRQSVVVLSAPGGGLKTWLCLALGSAVADGKIFLDYPMPKMPTYYCDYENPLALLADRSRFLGPSSMLIWHLSNPFPPVKMDTEQWALLKQLQPGMLIIDTLRSAQDLDDNSSKDMAPIMGKFKELREMGFTVLIIHHTPKADDRKYKGSTAISDLADHTLVLERVRAVGSDEAADDQDDNNLPLRLGVRGKTRYDCSPIFIRFDSEKGFVTADDPNISILSAMEDLLSTHNEEHGQYPIQTVFQRLCKEKLNLSAKAFRKLLAKGTDRYWKMTIGDKNSRIFEPISVFTGCPKKLNTGKNRNRGKTEVPDWGAE